MNIFSSGEMRKLDERAIRECGIPSLILMEHAGREAAQGVRDLLGNAAGKKITAVCGPGNNGGDGLAAARILHDWGAEVEIFMAAPPQKLKGDPKQNYDILTRLGMKTHDPLDDPKRFRHSLAESDCIVDALFGTGLKHNLETGMANLVDAINESGKPVLAVDLPSGIDGDDGKILGTAVSARLTITLGAPKVGLYLYPGRELAGEIRVAYIGIPREVVSDFPVAAFLLEKKEVASWLPNWKPDIHKGERGRLLIIGGSRGLSGAPVLSAAAALESGTGLVYLAVPDGIRNLIEHKLTDAIKVGLPQTKDWVLGKISLAETRERLKHADALAIGPGLGRDPETAEYAKTVLMEYPGRMVVDADALYPLDEAFLKSHGKPAWVLTPHEGEMARICGVTAEEVRQHRLELAREKSESWNVTLVLKGASTLVASGGKLWVNLTGNPGMAVGGSGDILTGLLGSLLAQGLDPEKAAGAAVLIHGLAGDLCAKDFGVRGVTASKLAVFLPASFKALSD